MKALKVLSLVAALGSAFGGAGVSAAVVSICPVGGACSAPAPEPASSKSSAVSVDVTRAPVAAPVIVVDQTPAPGSYCGWAVVNQGSSFNSGGPEPYADGVPCQGHPVASLPNGSTTLDCPAGYRAIETGASVSGDQWFSCIKL